MVGEKEKKRKEKKVSDSSKINLEISSKTSERNQEKSNKKQKVKSEANKRIEEQEKEQADAQKLKDDAEEEINFKYNVKVYLSLLKKYKGLIAILMVLIIIFEVSMIADRLILKKIIDQATLFTSHSITVQVFGAFILLMGISYLIIILIRSVANWFKLHLINRLEGRAILDMKKRFFNHIVDLSHGFHTSNKTGSLISRFVRGGSAVERMTDTLFFDMIPLVVQVIAVVIAVFVFDWVTSLIIVIIVVVFLTFSLAINKVLRKSNIEANDREDDEKAYISDVFINIDSIKYFGKENAMKSRYYAKGKITKDALLKNWDYYRWLTAGQTFIIGIGIVALLVLPFMRFMNNDITLGEIVFIYTIYGNLTSPLYRFVGGIRSYYRAMADFDALFKYELSHNEIIDAPNAKELVVGRGAIEFRNVSFSYKERKIISDLKLKVAAGKRVALVGSSGAGKSTVVKLLYRLYDVQEGAILIDGKNINSFKQESLRSELSIVPQDCVLFDDTIYNNIAFSRPEATRDEVMNAIKLAQLDNIVSRMPKSEETIVGERGVKLSGGERQRVSIARAILANKRILVLDEATSSLDSETEHEIQLALHDLMKGRTSIIIAHRLSTVMSADLIVVLDEGKVAQIGTHNELIKHKGIYRKLWNLQKGGYLE